MVPNDLVNGRKPAGRTRPAREVSLGRINTGFTFAQKDYRGRLRTAEEVHDISPANLDRQYCNVTQTKEILRAISTIPVAFKRQPLLISRVEIVSQLA